MEKLNLNSTVYIICEENCVNHAVCECLGLGERNCGLIATSTTGVQCIVSIK